MKTVSKSKFARDSLRKQTEENYNRRNEGSSFNSIFKDDVEINQWICRSSEEAHIVDLIPYVASANHPNKKIKAGELVYTVAYYVHKRVGANNLMFICPGQNFGEPCPICEERKRLSEEYGFDDDRVKALKPSLQSLYNVVVYDNEEEEKKGIQVWMVPHFFVERKLLDISKKPRDGGIVYFADPDVGKTISFYRKGKENVEFTGHQFLDREYAITDEEIESAYVLEDLVYKPSYDEIALAFYGHSGKEEVDDRKHSESSRRSSRTEEVEDRKQSRRVSEKEKLSCPEDGEFGVDIDQLTACGECSLYDDCAIEADRIEEEGKRKKEEVKEQPISKVRRRG